MRNMESSYRVRGDGDLPLLFRTLLVMNPEPGPCAYPDAPAGPFAGAVVFIVRILVGISVPLALRRALPEALQQRESGVDDGEG